MKLYLRLSNIKQFDLLETNLFGSLCLIFITIKIILII